MILYGVRGVRLGILERFEIDPTGQITNIVARGLDATARRIAAEHVCELRLGAITVELTAAEFKALPEVVAPRHALTPVDQPRLSA